mgnify:CR=1 FL=1
MNVIKNVIKYAFNSNGVYPKYSLREKRVVASSGFREHSVHLCIGFGTLGDIRHGIMVINFELINTIVETILE